MRLILALTAAAGLSLTACEVDQTKEAQAPDVDINASGGQLPEYDVDAKEVVVGTTNTTIDVPKIETQKETVSVPVVGVKDNGEE